MWDQTVQVGVDSSSVLVTIVGLTFVGLVMYLANQVEVDRRQASLLRWLLYGLVSVNFGLGLIMLQITFRAGGEGEFEKVNPVASFVLFVVIIISSILCFQVVAKAPRALRVIQWAAGEGNYNPESMVHNAAVVLALALVAMTLAAFVLGGGLSGFAEDLQSSGISISEPVFIAVLEITAAFLGVGLAIRRTWQQSLQRLGLRLPTTSDVRIGIAMGAGLYFFATAFALVWQQLIPPEQLQEQTRASEQLALSFATLPLAFLVSIAAALGEEIFIRGALQPVFGLVTTSAFFSLLHTQYLITPGLLLIFVISVGLGWVRRRSSTSAAIIAHFVYNFIQLAFLVLQLSSGAL